MQRIVAQVVVLAYLAVTWGWAAPGSAFGHSCFRMTHQVHHCGTPVSHKTMHDDCCHNAAHFAGLLSVPSTLSMLHPEVNDSVRPPLHLLLVDSPPTPPPRQRMS